MNFISDALMILIYMVGFLTFCLIIDIAHNLAYKYIPAYTALWDKLCSDLSKGL